MPSTLTRSPISLAASGGRADHANRSGRDPITAIPDDAPFSFRDRNILMLQGPVGPFFDRLAQDLRWAGANVHKLNFNGGDWFYWHGTASRFNGELDTLEDYLGKLCTAKRIDLIMLFGDCRPHHVIARRFAERAGIEVLVFEEGYVRPNYITMERSGVNGFSTMPRSPIFYLNTPAPPQPEPMEVGPSMRFSTVYAFIYYFWSVLLWPAFFRYHHHRPLNWWEGLRWVRGTWRKYWYMWTERETARRLMSDDGAPYFLIPLQVHSDAQIGSHSGFESMEQFIAVVMASFAAHAPDDTRLVFKHHPMDRPYTAYHGLIRRLVNEHKLYGRVDYIHDQSLPDLLKRTRGVVTINSTTGISAIHRMKPTLVLGNAIYKIDGLTANGSLDKFWQDAPRYPVHRDLYHRFRHHLIYRTQINGNFYRRLDLPGSSAGLNWNRLPTDHDHDPGSAPNASC